MMKKYLIMGVTALAAATTLSSCHDEEFQGSLLAAKAEAYETTFREAYGTIDTNQDWGFGSLAALNSAARTRGEGVGTVIKPDMTNFPGYSTDRCNGSNRSPEGYADVVAPVTEKERAWVMDWFSKNPDLSEQGLNISNFFIQDVGNNGYTKEGYFHTTEGGKPEEVTKKTYNDIKMDKLQVGPVATEAGTLHVLDYNATQGFNEWNLIYVEGGSALQFGYHESYGNSYEFKFKCVELEVPGSCFDDGEARKGWYVGLSYYCFKKETNEKWHEIGIDRLQYADDWVLKIVPGEGNNPGGGQQSSNPTVKVEKTEYSDYTKTVTTTTSYNVSELVEEGRVFCEDLGSTGQRDIDFNDVVFDARVRKNYTLTESQPVTYTIDGTTNAVTDSVAGTVQSTISDVSYDTSVKLLAAGGTLHLTVAGEEVHDKFGGYSHVTMINSVRDAGDVQSDVKYTTASPVEITGLDYQSIAEIPIFVKINDEVTLLEAIRGEVPRKMLVPLGTAWAKERTAIDAAYEGFKDYVNNSTNFWDQWDKIVAENLFNGDAVTDGYTATPEDQRYTKEQVGDAVTTDGGTTGGSTSTSYEEITVSQTVATPGDNETILWEGEQELVEGNVTISSTNMGVLAEGGKVRIYGIGADTNDYHWEVSVDANGSGGDVSGNLATNGYIEFDITANNLNIFKGKTLTVYGKNFKVTYVTFVPKAETPSTGGGSVIWTSPNADGTPVAYDASVSVDKSAFANATSSSIIRLYCTPTDPNWQFFVKDGKWNYIGQVGNYSSGVDISVGYVDYVIGDGLAALQASGLIINGNELKVSRIELR